MPTNNIRTLVRIFKNNFLRITQHVPQCNKYIEAEAGAYWDNSKEVKSVRDMSHWKGEGRFADEEFWERIGKSHLAMVREMQRMLDSTDKITSMIEWGPGGGANAVKFATEVERIYGVDISRSNLDECQLQLQKINFDGFNKIHFPIDQPEKCFEVIEEKVDLFLSTAVYQHFPSKAYGRNITAIAYRLLNENGLALIQIRYEGGRNIFFTKRRNYRKNFITFTSYPIHEFWSMASEIGFKPLAVRLKPSTNYAYFFLYKPN